MLSERLSQNKVVWYRSPVTRDQLMALNERSDCKGFVQTGGFLGLLALTGTAAYYSAGRWPWPVVLLLLFIHGTCWRFILHGFHELIHNTVFKTRWLNLFFVRLFAFLIWYNHHQFWASHTEHHKYTLHPPDDLEVVFPVDLTVTKFFLRYFVDPWGFFVVLYNNVVTAMGRPMRPWDRTLMADADPKEQRAWKNWSRFVLVGHATIIGVSVAMHWWMLPVVTTLAPYYGGWLCYLVNNLQHSGLRDNVPDYRLCCRTITINPVLGFLYWHMNYHTEHHMYAAVPCYNLPKLHQLIKADLPPCPHGLYQSWRHLVAILKKQKADPSYQYTAELPTRSYPEGNSPSAA
jgi:fatty acid desaturase